MIVIEFGVSIRINPPGQFGSRTFARPDYRIGTGGGGLDTSSSLAKRIKNLRNFLRISQAELGARLGTSAMAISRWERGDAEPSGRGLLKLGILSRHDPEICWNFWNRAGLTAEDVITVLPIAARRLRRTIPILRLVKAGTGKVLPKATEENLVAIPFLRVVATAGKEPGSSHHDLSQASFDQVIAAPRLWCPNPGHTVCMRVRGDSMEPTLFDGYIIVVDQKQTEKSKLHRKMIVAHHDKFGLVVSRFWRLKNSETLVSDNRSHDPVPLSPSWRIVGKVLWFIGECQQAS